MSATRYLKFACMILGTAGCVATASPSFAAANAEVLERLRALEQQIETQQRQLELQQRQIEAGRAEIEALKGQLQAAPDEPGQPAITMPPPAPPTAETQQASATYDRGRPTVTSRDGRFSISVRGRVQFDVAGYFQDEAGPLATDWRRGSIGGGRENIAATDLSSGTNFRRAQLGIEGRLGRNIGYRILPEFGGSGTEDEPRLHEGWLSYAGFSPWTFQVGAFPPPANLDDSSSSDDTMFLERATPAQLSRALAGSDGRVATGFTGSGRRWFAALHLTGSTFAASEVFDEQVSVVGRAAVLASTGRDHNIHLGINASYVMQPADTGGGATAARYIRFRDQPELRVDSTRLIDTGNIPAENAYAAGLEFAANYRSLTVQAEAFRYGIGRVNDPALDDPHFTGWYAQASYVFAGHRRSYDIRTGSYTSPRPMVMPDGAIGDSVWEFGMRYSHANLNFRAGSAGSLPPPGGIRGGEQDIWTVGLNWYPTPNMKLMLDYQNVSVDRVNPAGPDDPEPFGAGAATPPIGVQIGQTLHMLAVRTQYSF